MPVYRGKNDAIWLSLHPWSLSGFHRRRKRFGRTGGGGMLESSSTYVESHWSDTPYAPKAT